MNPIKEKIGKDILIFDGAMGTMIYSRGVFINTCFEELNLSNPKLIRGIHEEYRNAGADILESNTFGGNPLKLAGFGLKEKTEDINRRGVELAKEAANGQCYVAASIGPVGQALKPVGKLKKEDAENAYREYIQGLLKGEPDLILCETFNDLNELRLVLSVLQKLTDMPVIVQMAFGKDNRTARHNTPEQMLETLRHFPVTAVGVNCGVGPSHTLELVKHIVPLTDLPVSAQPNAGLPQEVHGRRLYLSSPEYLATYAQRMVQSGAKLVGGCCGTTPEHIKMMRAAIKAVSVSTVTVKDRESKKEEIEYREEVPQREKSNFAKKMADGKFTISIEISPPRGHCPEKVLEKINTVRDSGMVDIINIPDGPRAAARMSPLALAIMAKQKSGMENMLHYCCRDRNLLSVQADLLGMEALGLHNILIITGDPPKMGDYPDATAVFDVDSIGLTRIAKNLNRGIDLGGNAVGDPTRFFIGVGANPGAIDMDLEVDRFRQKVEAGAEFALTQPVFEAERLHDFLDRIKDFRIPVMVGILPLVSFRNAEFLHNEVPGMSVPENIRKKLKGIDSAEKAREYGVEVAQKSLLAVKDAVQGAYFMPPFGRIDSVLKILEDVL